VSDHRKLQQLVGTYNGFKGNGIINNLISNGGVGNNSGSGYQNVLNDTSANHSSLVAGAGAGAGGVGQNAIPNHSGYIEKAGDRGAGKQMSILSSSGGNLYGGGGGGAGYGGSSDISGYMSRWNRWRRCWKQ